MEITDISKTFIPCISSIPTKFVTKLISMKDSLEFLDLKNPVIRDIDKLWADLIFGDKAQDKLEQAKTLLSFLTNKRNP